MVHTFPRHGVWRTYTTADGLAGLQAMDVVQDPQGYLWIATVPFGLCRFDGEGFRTYTRADGLPGEHVYSLLIDRRGRLWVATLDGGVFWHDGLAFQQPAGARECAATCLYEDHQGRLWYAGGRGCGYCQDDRVHDLSEAYHQGSPPPPILACWGMAQDRHGDLWIGATGLVRYDGERFHWLASTGAFPEPFRGNHAVGSDGRGGVWVGNAQRLWHWDGERFEASAARIPLLVSSICLDRQGRSWICLGGGGALCWDSKGFHALTPDDGLAHGTVTRVHEDHEGLLWFTTWGGGVSSYDPVSLRRCGTAAELPAREVQTLTRDPAGHVWLGCGSASEMWIAESDQPAPLLAGQWRDGQVHRVPVPPGVQAGPCLAMATDAQGRVWMGGTGGAGWYQDGDFHFAHQCPQSVVTALYASPLGPVYLAWSDIRFQTTRLGRYTGSEVEVLHEQPGTQWIWAIRETQDGALWMALGTYGGQGRAGGIARRTADGLQRFTRAEGLADDRAEDLVEDREGRLWVATWGGLSRWDGKEFRTYTTADGLPHNHVRCLHQDPHGDLWLGTDAGVCHRKGRTFQTIHSPHVLGTNQILQDADGSLWFATLHGLVRYTPTAVRPRVRVVQVLADRTYPPSDPLGVPDTCGQVVFEYQGMSFRTPLAGMRYTCRLQGRESAWQPATDSRRAFYPDLRVGDYTFQVRSIDQDLNYSETAAIRLTVTPDPKMEALEKAAGQTRRPGQFVGASPALLAMQAQLDTVAQSETAVLLIGETGTGKELAARAVHQSSRRGGKPLMVVNCGALEPALAASELFGHEKGAFTGADRRTVGKVELAAGSSLFLDEIGELPAEVQVKLLRLAEEKTFERVGGIETLAADVRVIAATHRDLAAMVREGRFREDLYHRLHVFPVHLPPLRERREDIAALADYFLRLTAAREQRAVPLVSPAALRVLQQYAWPGNVRELRHEMERALLACRGGGRIEPEHLSLVPVSAAPVPEPDWVTAQEHERRYLQAVLEKTRGVVKGPRGAARILGIPESTLRDRIRRLGIQSSGEGRG